MPGNRPSEIAVTTSTRLREQIDLAADGPQRAGRRLTARAHRGNSCPMTRRQETTLDLAADPAEEVTAARAGDRDAFGALFDRYHHELQVHCYRLLGSYLEAEDLLQETFERAWRSLGRFKGDSSLRAWLYRIATNACLDALRQQGRRRVLPFDVMEPVRPGGPLPEAAGELWLEPFPDHGLHEAGPDPSEAAVKSALQRARATMRARLPQRRDDWAPSAAVAADEREVLERYVDAHLSGDVEAMAEVLADDVRIAYPQIPLWSDSREAFIQATREFAPPGEYRFVATSANLQPAVAIYLRPPGEAEFHLTALEVVRVEGGRITEIVDFSLPELYPAFGLAATLR
jgi:RNA polymerase sigma-70 factor, ECF subfamily